MLTTQIQKNAATDRWDQGSVKRAVWPALVCVALAISGCGPGERGASRKAESLPARAVRVAPAERRPMERVVPVIGQLAAKDEATLSMKVSGRLQEVPVDLGSVLREGDLIARVEPQDYELKLKQAEAMLAQARARLGLPLEGADDRFEAEQTSTVKQTKALLDEALKNRDRIAKLAAQGVLSQSELESAEAAYEVALNKNHDALEEVRNRQATLAQRRAEYEIAKKQLEDTAIYAPFPGAVQERRASVGEFHPAGSPVVQLVRVDPLRMRLDVPERESANIRPQLLVRLKVEGDTNVYEGRITRLSPAIAADDRMLVVEADVRNNGRLRPGLFAKAEIVVNPNEPGLAIPLAALITFAGVEKVFVVAGDKAVEKQVSTGRSGPGWVEIVQGLRDGDLVVIEPGNLQSGQLVRVTSSSPTSTSTSKAPVATDATARVPAGSSRAKAR